MVDTRDLKSLDRKVMRVRFPLRAPVIAGAASSSLRMTSRNWLGATIPMATLAVFRRIALEIGAGQIVEQDLEARTEQAFPARLEKAEERALVGYQLVQTAV